MSLYGRCVKHVPGCPGKHGGDHVTLRESVIQNAAAALHGRGVQPTSRNVLAEITGKPESHFRQGMGGQDVKYFRKAMLDLGYIQSLSGRWRWLPDLVPVELDEVRCADSTCPEYDLSSGEHTLADHTVGWNWK